MTELEKLNFFTDPSLVGDPSPYYDAMRARVARCSASRITTS